MKDGRIKQAGKYNDILLFGRDFMELIGVHEEALVSLDAKAMCSKTLCLKHIIERKKSKHRG